MTKRHSRARGQDLKGERLGFDRYTGVVRGDPLPLSPESLAPPVQYEPAPPTPVVSDTPTPLTISLGGGTNSDQDLAGFS